MKTRYLHLSAFSCDKCQGPVISGSTGIRENEISKEIDIREVGAICLSCGHRQSKATAPGELGILHRFNGTHRAVRARNKPRAPISAHLLAQNYIEP